MSISVYAPATIANLGVGFDLLGAAVAPVDGTRLGDIINASRHEDRIILECHGRWQHKLPADPAENIVWRCAEYFIDQLPPKCRSGVKMILEKNLPVGSGLGSSASSVVAAVYSLNELFERPFAPDELLLMMGKFEGQVSGSIHYDNVAPCFMGGLQLMLQVTGKICAPVPFFPDWFWIVAYPGFSLSTSEMRALLPQKYSRQDLIDYGRYLGGFIHASYRNDAALAASLVKDVVAEPYRSPKIPGYSSTAGLLIEAGALASGISGSGPTMFAIADDAGQAAAIAKAFRSGYIDAEQGFVPYAALTAAAFADCKRKKEWG
jgi:homoserine kinase